MASEHYKKTRTKHSFILYGQYVDYYYCRNCHEKSEIHRNRYKDIECPECNHITEKDFIVNGSGTDTTVVFNGLKFYDNGDKIRVFIYAKEISFYSKKVQQHHIATMVVFNIKTGQTYAFEPRYIGTSKRWKKYEGPRLKNISLAESVRTLNHSLPLENETVRKLLDLLQDKLSEKLGYPVKSIAHYFTEYGMEYEIVNIPLLANYVRMPNLNPLAFSKFIGQCRYQYDDKFLKMMRKVKHDTPDPYGDLIKAFKGPKSKFIRKTVMKNLKSLPALLTFSMFKDINNLIKIMKKAEHWHRSYHSDILVGNDSFNVFIEAMLKKSSENAVANKIASLESFYYLIDAANMYADIINQLPDYDFDIKRSIEELHDIFSKDYNKLSRPNIKIEYEEHEKEIECSIGDYDFKLAKDTHELIDIGTRMNICVGSYGYRAANKDLGIIVAYQDDEPIVCFELSSDFKQVLQAKLKHNRCPQGEVHEICLKFVEKNGMEISTYDLSYQETNTDSCHFQLPAAAV